MDKREAETLATATYQELSKLGPVCLPPMRCEAELDDTASFVYLDNWCWGVLADARFGRRDVDYEAIRRAVWAGNVSVPISQTHIRETGALSDPVIRAQVLYVMIELSGLAVVEPNDLMMWDAYAGLVNLHGLGLPTHRRRLNWGFESAFAGSTEFDEAAVDGRMPAEWQGRRDFPWQTLAEQPRLLAPADLDVQIKWLCSVPPAELVTVQPFVEAQQRIQTIFGGVEKQGRSVARSLFLVEQLKPMAPYLEVAAAMLGVGVELGTPEDVAQLVDAMPVGRVWSHLLQNAHVRQSKRNWSKNRNDAIDFFNIAFGAAVFDVVLVDTRAEQHAVDMPDGWVRGRLDTSLSSALIPS